MKTAPIPIKVLSPSMMPLIKINDYVLARQCDTSDLRPGDLVVFKALKKVQINNKLIGQCIHRIVFKSLKYHYFDQKGDASIRFDRVTFDRVIGKVYAIQKGDKTIYLDHGFWMFWDKLLAIKSIAEYYFLRLFRLLKSSLFS